MAATPLTPSIREAIGKNFAYRDYYKGVSKDWQPYVSEVFKRAVEPKYNVVSVAVPIKSDSAKGSDQKILGILLLTIKLDTVLDWAQAIEVGPAGFTYFVDRNGHVAGHPKFSSQGEVVDFSEVPAVKKVLNGEKGVEITYNQIEQQERVSAYEPVAVYGWGVIVAEPVKDAFAARDRQLRTTLIVYSFILLLTGVLAYVILRTIRIVNEYRQKEKTFLESIGDGVVAIDRAWNITLWNEAAASISGWAKEEALGKPFRDVIKLIRERDRRENIFLIEDAMVMGKVRPMEDHTVLITKDGREIPVGDSAAPIFDSSGNVSGAIIVFRDISKEQEARALRSDFAFASHQLRTPVNQALWHLEIALEKKDETTKEENLRTAYASLQSILELVNHLIEVSELDQGTIIPKIETVRLTDVLEETLQEVRAKAKERDVTIDVAPVSAVAGINTDKRLLKRTLFEILENAIAYSPKQGTVTFKSTIQEDSLLVEIRDYGPGIPQDQQPLVFTKFFRGKNVPPEIIGAGLGLYIAREYVKLLKGKIWFKSEPSKGTTFSIFLPIKPNV